MAIGWTRDGAVQDQIDVTIEEAVERARSQMVRGESLLFCADCDASIPEPRRQAIPGVQLCIECQSEHERQGSRLQPVSLRY